LNLDSNGAASKSSIGTRKYADMRRVDAFRARIDLWQRCPGQPHIHVSLAPVARFTPFAFDANSFQHAF
jgi:hypothetical protein